MQEGGFFFGLCKTKGPEERFNKLKAVSETWLQYEDTYNNLRSS